MPSSRDLYLIDARLSYLEEILASLFHISVDPPPPDVARGGGFQAEFRRRPGGPIVDPAVRQLASCHSGCSATYCRAVCCAVIMHAMPVSGSSNTGRCSVHLSGWPTMQ